jgi:hypothetical protein
MKRPRIYGLWFQFLRLAYSDQRQQVRDALERSRSFYAPWGDVTNAQFHEWFRDHRYLFEDKYAVRKLTAGEPPSDPDALIVEIPLRRSQSVLSKQVTRLIRDEIRKQPQRPGKSKEASTAQYRLTEGAEPKLLFLYDMFIAYRVHLNQPEARGKRLLNEVRKIGHVPTPLDDSHGTLENRLRNLHRYITKAEQVVLNVANGEFPGRY